MAVTPPTTAIHCGEFVQAVYDSINPNEGKYWCLPLYGKSSLFTVARIGTAYRITHYIYCTVEGFGFRKTVTVWIGYIAESSEEETRRLGRRDIVVAIRGTTGTDEWIKNFSSTLSDFPFVQTPASGAKVHAGFLSIYNSTDPNSNFGGKSMRDQISDELSTMLSHNDNSLPVGITITGHSLGGALATLVACDIGCNIAPKYANVSVSSITFGSPKVGNKEFKINAEMHTAFITRYRSIGDPVPLLPPDIWPLAYVHVGTELILDWASSPYVSISRWYPWSFKCHNLELHMHVLAAEGSGAVYTSTQLENLLMLARFALLPAGAEYIITDLSQRSAWDDRDRDVVRGELEAVKDRLQGDEAAIEAFLKEVNYIAVTRENNGAGGLRASSSTFDGRDHSLLNKSDDVLKEEYCVPAKWLVHPNKDMVWDQASQAWLPRVKRPHDIPTPDNPEFN